MNAIPQKAYHDYERIQLPRAAQGGGRVSDMEAYRMQKVAAQRRRLAQRDEQNTARRVGEQQRRPIQPAQKRQAIQSKRQPVQQRSVQRETQTERARIRQTGVQNVVGGRRLTPAYEGAPAYNNNRREYTGATVYREQAYGNTGYVRPRQAGNYGGYAKPRSYERTPEIQNTAYNGVKPIAVEYESPKKKGVVSTILLIAFVFAILSGIVVRYASISNLSLTNTQAQAQNEALQDELDKVKMENALKEDLNGIQERATQLGMYYPKDDQIEYLESDASDADAAQTQESPDVLAQAPAQAQESTTEPAEKTQTGSFDGIKTFFADLMKVVGEWFGK